MAYREVGEWWDPEDLNAPRPVGPVAAADESAGNPWRFDMPDVVRDVATGALPENLPPAGAALAEAFPATAESVAATRANPWNPFNLLSVPAAFAGDVLGGTTQALSPVMGGLEAFTASPIGQRLHAGLVAGQYGYPQMVRSQAVRQEMAMRQQAMASQQRERALAAEIARRYPNFDPNDPRQVQGILGLVAAHRGDPVAFAERLAETQKTLAETRKIRREIEGMGQPEPPEPPKMSDVQALRKTHLDQMKMYREQERAYEAVKLAQATGMGDFALVSAFARMIDPGSTVREEERQALSRAGGLAAEVASFYNRVAEGGKLPSHIRAQIVNQADTYIAPARQLQRERIAAMEEDRQWLQAQGARVPPAFVPQYLRPETYERLMGQPGSADNPIDGGML